MRGGVLMAEQKKKDSSKHREEGEKNKAPEPQANPEVVEKGKKMKEDIDGLIDEIDDVLHENSEEFVKNYVQKGGE